MEYVIGKNPCPKCRSKGEDLAGDNFHFYGEGQGGYCYKCGYTLPSDDWLEEHGELNYEEWDLMAEEFSLEIHEKLKAECSYNPKGYRGIREDVSRWFGVLYEFDEETGEVVNTYYPCTKNYEISGYKVRGHPKKFHTMGEVGKDNELFGQHRFKTFTNTILIVPGEHDQLASFQMLKDAQKNRQFDPPAVVSPTIGESGAWKQIQNHYEYFDQFKKIIVCMDSDDVGEKAVETIVDVLPRGKVFVMKMRYKDPNEYIEKGCEREFISDFWNARPYTIDGMKSSFDGFLDIKKELDREVISLPDYMHKLQYNMGGGFKQGAIHNIIAATGVSKTTHIRNIVYHMIMELGLKPTIISLEETAAQYSLNLLQVHAKENFTFGKSGTEILEYLETPRMRELQQELMLDEYGEPRYFLVDERSGDVKQIEKQIERLFFLGLSNIVIIDVLSDLTRGSSADLAEDHMSFQRRMAKEGMTILSSHHTRKMGRGKDGDDQEPTEWDALGTGSFIQSGHTNILLHRDKSNDCKLERNTTRVTMPKCRGGITGDAGEWYWDFHTYQCYDKEDFLRDNPQYVKSE